MWPALLSNKLDVACKNLAIPGNSNWAIARRLMSVDLTADDMVVIAWSHPNRIEFGVNADYIDRKSTKIYQENSRDDFVWMGDVVEKHDQVLCRRILPQLHDVPGIDVEPNLKYFSYMCYNEFKNKAWLHEMFLVMYSACRHVLEQSNCKWRMFNAWALQYDGPNKSILDHPNYLLGYDCDMTSHIRENNKDLSYWTEQEHIAVADIVYENIRSK